MCASEASERSVSVLSAGGGGINHRQRGPHEHNTPSINTPPSLSAVIFISMPNDDKIRGGRRRIARG